MDNIIFLNGGDAMQRDKLADLIDKNIRKYRKKRAAANIAGGISRRGAVPPERKWRAPAEAAPPKKTHVFS